MVDAAYIKAILLAGGGVKWGYKEHLDDWWCDVSIGITYKRGGHVIIHGFAQNGFSVFEKFEVDKLDEAIEWYRALIFNPKNLVIHLSQALDELGIHQDEDSFSKYQKKKIRAKLKEIWERGK